MYCVTMYCVTMYSVTRALNLFVVFVFAAGCANLTASSEAYAARVGVVGYERNDPTAAFFEPRCNIRLAGTIQAGDVEKAKAALDKMRLSPLRKVADNDDRQSMYSSEEKGFFALCLASEGGDLREALRIAELFKGATSGRSGWMTVVEAGDTCTSACAILFMSTKRRSRVFVRMGPGPGDWPGPGRYLHWSAKLGFHAPSLIMPEGATETLTVAQVSEAYDRAIATMAAIVFHGYDIGSVENLDRPLAADERSKSVNEIVENDQFIHARSASGSQYHDFIPNDLLAALMAMPASSMLQVTTVGQLHRWGIEPYGIAPPQHISERMLITACAQVAYARCLLGGPRNSCTTLGSGRAFFTSRNDLIDRPPGAEPSDASPDDHFKRLKGFFSTSVAKLWPAAGKSDRLSAYGFTLTRTLGSGLDYKQCGVRVVYRDGMLVGFDVATFNGQGDRETKGVELDFTEYDAKDATTALDTDGRKGLVNRVLVRPWVMLPAGRKRADLGTQPWAALEKGGPAFAAATTAPPPGGTAPPAKKKASGK